MRPRVTKAVPATAAFVICLVLAGCSEQINYLKARNELNKGVKAFSAADYPTAAQHFEAAIELDGQLLDARSYRAYSYMMQFIPGGESAENLKVAGVALEGFEEVLKYDANNNLALSSIASLHFNMKEFDKARSPRQVSGQQGSALYDWGDQLDAVLPAAAGSPSEPWHEAGGSGTD
jgi:Tfp pilus assembly protein PilF